MSATAIQGEGIGMRESLDERPASEGGPYGAPTGEAGGRIGEVDGLRG